MADVTDSKSVGETRVGSSPTTGTIEGIQQSLDSFFCLQLRFIAFLSAKLYINRYISPVIFVDFHFSGE